MEQVVTYNTAYPGSPAFFSGLCPGDVMLYARHSFFNTLIAVKTWSRFTHCEVVAREDWQGLYVHSFASRNGIGCRRFCIELDGIALILRPESTLYTFDQAAAIKWFDNNRVDLQGYDWLGLLNFTYAKWVGPQNGKMFCSEFVSRFLRAGGVDPFPEIDSDTVAPRDFTMTRGLRVVWRSPDEWRRWELARAEGRAGQF